MIWQVLVFSDNILPKEMKSIWKDLGSNSGPPAWQISTETNRPWLLRWHSFSTDDTIVLLAAERQSWLFKNVRLLFPEALVSFDNVWLKQA